MVKQQDLNLTILHQQHITCKLITSFYTFSFLLQLIKLTKFEKINM